MDNQTEADVARADHNVPAGVHGSNLVMAEGDNRIEVDTPDSALEAVRTLVETGTGRTEALMPNPSVSAMNAR